MIPTLILLVLTATPTPTSVYDLANAQCGKCSGGTCVSYPCADPVGHTIKFPDPTPTPTYAPILKARDVDGSRMVCLFRERGAAPVDREGWFDKWKVVCDWETK